MMIDFLKLAFIMALLLIAEAFGLCIFACVYLLSRIVRYLTKQWGEIFGK